MAELENVLYALNCRATDAPSTCSECSYYNAEWCCCNTKYIMKDALDLLNAQMPKVMTLEEVEHPCVEIFYLEEKDGIKNRKNYGKTWRFWSARPTEEQRKAVKWDD